MGPPGPANLSFRPITRRAPFPARELTKEFARLVKDLKDLLDSNLGPNHDTPGCIPQCIGSVFNVRLSNWKYGLSSMVTEPVVLVEKVLVCFTDV